MSGNIKDIYPLSPMQQGMLFHSLYSPESGMYSELLCCTLQGRLDQQAFRNAWEQVVLRHDTLRSAFVWENLDEPLQAVYDAVELPFEILDWSNQSEAAQEQAYEAKMAEERQLRFDFNIAPLMRLTLIRKSPEAHYLIWNHHHLLLDGWCLPIILKEVFLYYEAFRSGQKIQLPSARSYRDYIAWLQNQDKSEAQRFWRSRLQGFSAPTPMVINRRSKPETVSHLMERLQFSADESGALYRLAKDSQVTINTLLQAAWALLLGRYSREDDIAFGSTVSGRPPELSGVETMVGLFINTLPVRVSLAPGQRVTDWLKGIQAQQAEARRFEYTPLYEIQKWAEIPHNQALFDSLLIFENYPVGEELGKQESSLAISDLRTFEKTNYPITLVSAPGKQLALDVAFEDDHFRPQDIRRMLQHLRVILLQFAAAPQEKLEKIRIITDSERNLILRDWNNSSRPSPVQSTLHELFEDQVRLRPDSPAVTLDDRLLTYRELNEQANQLAWLLHKKGLSPETVVGISLHRSIEQVVALLAVLKAGGAYLPIDPEYPQDRIAHMIQDSGITLLITQNSLKDLFNYPGLHLLIPENDRESISAEAKDNLPAIALPQNLAYIIYTSGSTGRSKGVLLQHQGAVNFFRALIRDSKIAPGKNMLQSASFSFDGAVGEIFTGLLSGACLHLVRKETFIDVNKLVEFLNAKQITTTTIPPSLLTSIPPEQTRSLETILSVGDTCPWNLARRWMNDKRFMNGYGPTEISIGATWQVISEEHPETMTAPIGKPIDNMQIYLLDANLNLVPPGIPGEICIGGIGLARGYLHRPDLTAEKFIPDLYGQEAGARLYKTGDLARWLDDGSLEFMGRVDFQVKIRGFRIELGEIESVMREMPGIRDAVVLARGKSVDDKILAAYVLANEGQSPDISEMRSFLKERLPDYMVPNSIMLMEAFPLSPNGKVNRFAFPEPETGATGAENYVAPGSPEEELLAAIWSAVLGRDMVSAQASFFDLGGHSLLATQVISRVREAFGVDIQLRSLFEQPTIAAMAAEINRLRRSASGISAPPLQRVSRDQLLPLSFAQQRLWFLNQLEPGSPSYNIPSALRLTGRLNIGALEFSLHEVIRRHEALRTCFSSDEGKPALVIRDATDFSIEQVDLSGIAESGREAELQRQAMADLATPFDLANGPLLRATLLRLSETEHALLFNMHHIISDGWSIGVLISEISQLYRAYVAGQPSPLPELEIQYADFAHWQRDWLQGEILENQIAYWKKTLADAPPLLEMPTDHPRPKMQTFNGAAEEIRIPVELGGKLTDFSRKMGVTPFMALLAAWQTLLHRYSGQDVVLVGSPIANRTHSSIEKIIGFFVNTLIFKADFSGNPTFADLLLQVREMSLGAYAHQDLPFEKLVDALQPQRDMSHSPLFQVAFALQNAPMQAVLELPDLKMQAISQNSVTAKYDMTLTMIETGETVFGSLEYNTDLFERPSIQRLLRHFTLTLERMITDPEQHIGSFALLTAEEKTQSLVTWNNSGAPFPHDRCVHQWFEDNTSRQPDALAASFMDKPGNTSLELTYRELNERANRLARHLIKLGAGPEKIVGICMERSLSMVISMLAVLKAGSAYVPIDPAYPAERIQYMIEDSALCVLLTQESIRPGLQALYAKTISIDAAWPQTEHPDDANLNLKVDPENLAYVIYTSGSTGQPKGAMLRHRGACNLAAAQIAAFNVRQESRIMQFASLSFDAATWEFLMAMMSGGALILTSAETIANGQALAELLEAQKVTTITIPPSVLAVLPEKKLPNLDTIITAGEAVSADLVKTWRSGRRFFNAYGPTETTVCAAMHLCEGEYLVGPPIGKPINNFRLYILDQYSQPVPVGVAGELCMAGIGLARGYLGKPHLTAEKFIPESFSGERGALLYRSGDLARYLPNGDIEFLGRIDQQVKIRGFRIELGEIEALLDSHEHIADAAVIAREDRPGDKRLAAYVVPADSKALNASDLKNYLRERLPEYMVPGAIVVMDNLPLTPNGKLDRKSLPVPEISRETLGSEYVAPRNESEQKLVAIVSELLNAPKVGVNDNFFELGGHSLLATQFISRVRTEFGLELPLRALFEHPTCAGIAEALQAAKDQPKAAEPAPSIQRVSRTARTIKRTDLQ